MDERGEEAALEQLWLRLERRAAAAAVGGATATGTAAAVDSEGQPADDTPGSW